MFQYVAQIAGSAGGMPVYIDHPFMVSRTI